MNNSTKSISALLVKVVDREQSTEVSSEQYTRENHEEYVRFDVSVEAIFKRTPPQVGGINNIIKRGPMTWLVPQRGLECACPKIKVNK